jgi:hypothetical protein
VKLTGFRQQVFNTPIYYESESSAGYYRMYFADTNGVFPGTELFRRARRHLIIRCSCPGRFLAG